jgi:hypothetical protein
MQGLYFLTFTSILIGIVMLVLIDVAVLAMGVALFNRETILVRWK